MNFSARPALVKVLLLPGQTDLQLAFTVITECMLNKIWL